MTRGNAKDMYGVRNVSNDPLGCAKLSQENRYGDSSGLSYVRYPGGSWDGKQRTWTRRHYGMIWTLAGCSLTISNPSLLYA